jgi:predicted MPP superfamily phosphohydrolase
LALFNGQDGRPLTYIILKDPIPPMEATVPPFGQAGARFGCIRDEIEASAPHDAPEYHVDIATVLDILNDVIGDHKNYKTWIKSYARLKNERAAWESFKNHYRGTNQMEAMEANAEKQLSTLIYSGEKPRFNFELHVSKHLQAHLDIEKAGGDMREQSKVRKLLDSLQAKNLDAVIAYVPGNDQLQENFDRAVSYIRTFIIATNNTETRNVASVQRSNKRVHFEDKKDNKERQERR